MNDMFYLNWKDMRRLQLFFKNAPKKFLYAARGVMNTMAFGTRKTAIEEINRSMTVRNERFVSSGIRVQKARGSRLDSLFSVVGSIYRDNFSGWEEQETGKRTKRKRTQTIAARRGSWKRRVPSSYRLKSGNQFPGPEEYQGKNSEHRVVVMLNVLKKRKYKRPFVIKGHRKFRSGLYTYKSKRLVRLQTFNPKRKQPKRNPWMSTARKKYLNRMNLRDIWAEQIERQLKYKK